MNRFLLALALLIILLMAACEELTYDNPFDSNTELSPDDWAPTNLTAEILTDSLVQLLWQEIESQIDGFRIERKDSTDGVFTEIGTSETISYTDIGLVIGSDYNYRVCAYSGENKSSYRDTILVKYWQDCLNVWGGDALKDNCGVCGGDGSTCVQIGDQIWMAENLKVTHYRNGDEILTGYSESDWENLSTGAYAVYDDNESNADTYGYLYNWHTVDDERGVCPDGWHVPTDAEFTLLTNYLGGESVGGKMKSTGTIQDGNGLWNYSSDEITEEATNQSGFTGLPSGYRRNSDGSYINRDNIGYFWSSTSGNSGAWKRQLQYDNSTVNRSSNANKRNGFSIRCLRD
jgi:uncharacterized protein (TIGR02145 family)